MNRTVDVMESHKGTKKERPGNPGRASAPHKLAEEYLIPEEESWGGGRMADISGKDEKAL
jgi:hypothetical protein